MKEILSKLWNAVSFLLVLYGFYLLFLFFYDTTLRVKEGLALPLSLALTSIIVGVSAFFWIRKHLQRIKLTLGRG